MIQKGNSFISFLADVGPVFTAIKYGYLYNWYAASDPLFAPAGWRVPSAADWDVLCDTLLWTETGTKTKETGIIYWNDPNSFASNSTNLNIRGNGTRYNSGEFYFLNEYSYIWTSTSINTTQARHRWWSVYDNSIHTASTYDKKSGDGVRLLKDDSTLVSSLTDVDGNVYPTTKIGTQVWTAMNWKCTKLNNSTSISNVTDNTSWAALTTGAYCAYNNDENNV